jgi:hypothetical protein
MKTLKKILVVAAALAALAVYVFYGTFYGMIAGEEIRRNVPPKELLIWGTPGFMLLVALRWAYKNYWVDWIHLPLAIAWTAIALGGEKYIAGAYSLTKWEVGGGYLFGMLAFAFALFVPLHLWEIKIPQLVEPARKRLVAAYGFTTATLLVQLFLRFGAETWIRNTPDAWGWLVSLAAITAMLGALGYVLWQLHRSTRCFLVFWPSRPHYQ